MLRNLFSKRLFKVFLGATVAGGVGYATSQFNQYILKQSVLPESTIALASQESQPQLTPPTVNLDNNDIVAVEVVPESKQIQTQKPINDQKKEKQEEKNIQDKREAFTQIRLIDQFVFNTKFQPGQMVLIVADLPFTPEFEGKIVAQINKLKSRFKYLKVYRKDILSDQAKQYFQRQFRAKIEQQTLFLLRNEYDKGLNYFNFDMYMQFPVLLESYLRNVTRFQEKDIDDLKSKLAALSPYESCTLYLYDKDEPAQKLRQRMMTVKFLEMQMVVNNLNGITLFAVEKAAAVKSGLIDEANSRTNSLHLFRKHNIYTPFDPNFNLTHQSQSLPFFRLSDIALFQSGGNRLMIPSYLSGLQTFDSFQSAAPFACTVRVDRNKISEQDYNKLLRIFGDFKRRNLFPDVSFSLKLKEVPYGGKDLPRNRQWQINLANIEEMDKESMMHQITQHRQLQVLGFDEKTYMKTRPEFIYENGVIDSKAIEQFIAKAIKGELNRYYKSEEKHPLSNIRATTANTFSKDVHDGKHHVLYEYSEYCPTCKKISPYISLLVEYIEKKGLGLDDIGFYHIDANKNRVRGNLSSPFIPNLYYYRPDWTAPARFHIQYLSGQGVASLFHFCRINKQVKTIPWKLIDKSVDNYLKYRAQLLQL